MVTVLVIKSLAIVIFRKPNQESTSGCPRVTYSGGLLKQYTNTPLPTKFVIFASVFLLRMLYDLRMSGQIANQMRPRRWKLEWLHL